ncbi:unnamed protein product, partial [Symbiodinium necroappetens]
DGPCIFVCSFRLWSSSGSTCGHWLTGGLEEYHKGPGVVEKSTVHQTDQGKGRPPGPSSRTALSTLGMACTCPVERQSSSTSASSASQARRELKDPSRTQALQLEVQQRTHHASLDVSIDDILLASWRAKPAGTAKPNVSDLADLPLTKCVQGMWNLRDQIHKAGTRRKTAKVEEAVRLQLRTADGGLQTHESEFQQIVKYFQDLYRGPAASSSTLREGFKFSKAEFRAAFQRLQASKALPSCTAPAPLWKLTSETVIPLLQAQFEHHLQSGTELLPEAWCISDLVLIPKMRSPAHLRPICLLPLQAKVLASMLAQRLQAYAEAYLQDCPQFAYVANRSLTQALDRVLSHCAATRARLHGSHPNVHEKRQGLRAQPLAGGCQLSLGISRAYDDVPRTALTAALQDAQVPADMIRLIMMIHAQAKLRVRHCQQEACIATGKGLRQGCGLAPLLWSVYSCWLLRQLDHPPVLSIGDSGTVYADDMHFAWNIFRGIDIENAHQAMKHVLAGLRRFGLQVSTDKTVVILSLAGPLAEKTLRRYVVDRPEGQCIRFLIDNEYVHIKLATEHVYLGAVIGYGKFETATFTRRLRLAKAAYSRLGVILRNKTVPLRLRLQLWQGCVWPTLLRSLDSVGVPAKEMSRLQILLITQARTIARSHSMLTKETNVALIRRLRLPDPVRPDAALQQWRWLVRGHLFDAKHFWLHTAETASPSCKLVPVDHVIHEVFDCKECGQQFSTAAALKKHHFETHFDEEQQQARSAEVAAARNTPNMEHALNGMPTCRHCLHEFTTWHAFFYHVNTLSCPELRRLSEGPDSTESRVTVNEPM